MRFFHFTGNLANPGQAEHDFSEKVMHQIDGLAKSTGGKSIRYITVVAPRSSGNEASNGNPKETKSTATSLMTTSIGPSDGNETRSSDN
jgi:hypothetical protein